MVPVAPVPPAVFPPSATASAHQLAFIVLMVVLTGIVILAATVDLRTLTGCLNFRDDDPDENWDEDFDEDEEWWGDGTEVVSVIPASHMFTPARQVRR